jgi:MFS family permease
VAAVGAVALGISGPWRGRRLDQLGVRRAIAPSIVVLAATWSVAPWVGYWPLLGLSALAGLFTVPTFSIIRAVLIGAVREDQRTTALSVDAIATEMTYMVGPILGVIAATTMPTNLALFLCEMASVLGSVLMWWANPPILSRANAVDGPTARLRLTAPLMAVLGMSAAAILIFTGIDLATVAALRDWHQQGSIGWVLALWGLGSAIGGLLYGALRRPPSAALLLALVAATTIVIGLAHERLGYAILLTISGVFVAPAMTALTEAIARIVPPANRGEAMGWHGSAFMVGSAAGAPLVGFVIDRGGWTWGVYAAGGIGLIVALVGLVATARAHAVALAEAEAELASV